MSFSELVPKTQTFISSDFLADNYRLGLHQYYVVIQQRLLLSVTFNRHSSHFNLELLFLIQN